MDQRSTAPPLSLQFCGCIVLKKLRLLAISKENAMKSIALELWGRQFLINRDFSHFPVPGNSSPSPPPLPPPTSWSAVVSSHNFHALQWDSSPVPLCFPVPLHPRGRSDPHAPCHKSKFCKGTTKMGLGGAWQLLLFWTFPSASWRKLWADP